MRDMKALAVTAALFAMSCTDSSDPMMSDTAQALCTIEDFEIGNCPATAWRVNYTHSYALSIDPNFLIVGNPHCTGDIHTGDITCNLSGDVYIASCRWFGDGSVDCDLY